MNEIILLKLGEMVLKGLNRRSFEDKLQANIHRRLWPYGQFKVYTRQSTTYVEPKNDDCDVEGAFESVQQQTKCSTGCGKCHDAIFDVISQLMSGATL